MSKKDIQDEEILRLIRFSVSETTASTFRETTIDTQLSIERGVIWLIHFIQIEMLIDILDVSAAGVTETATLQITRESKSTILDFDDADIVAKFSYEKRRSATIGTESGPLMTEQKSPMIQNYPVPLIYAGQNIHAGFVGSGGTNLKTVRGRIGYTIRRVSDKFFFRVAQSLVG